MVKHYKHIIKCCSRYLVLGIVALICLMPKNGFAGKVPDPIKTPVAGTTPDPIKTAVGAKDPGPIKTPVGGTAPGPIKTQVGGTGPGPIKTPIGGTAPGPVKTKVTEKMPEPEPKPEFDEVSIFLNVNLLGGSDMQAVIKGKDIYLPIVDLFTFLRIKANYTGGIDTISGFFINPKNTYFIDGPNYKITYEGKTYILKPTDFVRTESNLFLKSNFFSEIFGLDCNFDAKNLSVQLKSKTELPAIREMVLAQMRANLGKLKGDFKADTVIGRHYPFFHFGTVDWSLGATEQINGTSNDRANVALGGILAGGEFNGVINYSSYMPFIEKQQFYLWRYANNENRALRQIMAGKIAAQSIATIYDPIVGVQITNAPTYYRKSFGTYALSDYTSPGWTVELYVNNTLIDYVKADASGFFTFNVPLIYGSTVVTLRYYGPWGEEQTSVKNISIPFNFLPANEFEYRVSSGVVEDRSKSIYSQARLNYGLTSRVTVGGGLEYFSSLSKTPLMPFVNTSMRIASNILVSGEYILGVRAKGVLSYHTQSNFQIELNYTKYSLNQEAIKNSFTEERRITLSMPFHVYTINAFSKLTVNQNFAEFPNNLPDMPLSYVTSKFTNAEWLISGSYGSINVNLTTLVFSRSEPTPYANSNLSVSLLLPKGINISPQVKFEYNTGKFSSVKCNVEKHVSQYGVLNVSAEQNFLNNAQYYQLGYKHDFSFAHVGLFANHAAGVSTFSQSANGSIIIEPKAKYADFNASVNVGLGGVIFAPFLDFNGNGKWDAGEPKVKGLSIRTSVGGSIKNGKDSTVIISGLEPYTDFCVEFSDNSFENISWKISKHKLKIAIDPNQLKRIEVPVAIVGEISGMVYMDDKNGMNGIGRIKVNIYTSDSVLVASELSEADGYFNYIGLSPGSYFAKIDAAQMKNLKFTATPTIPFVIHRKTEGDVIDNFKFILTK